MSCGCACKFAGLQIVTIFFLIVAFILVSTPIIFSQPVIGNL